MPRVEVDLLDIFEYVGPRRRPMQEGEALFRAGHVILCQIECPVLKKIFALVLQTSALTSPPHEVKITLGGSEDSWQCQCSCKAGESGYCKHVIGVLIYINRFEELDLLSCTDVKQAWGKEKEGIRMLYEAQPFSEFCHPKMKTQDEVQPSAELNATNFQRLLDCEHGSALYTFKLRAVQHHQLTRCTGDVGRHQNIELNEESDLLQKFLSNCAKSDFLANLCLESVTIHPCCKDVLRSLQQLDNSKVALISQRTAEWHKIRQLRITGSKCYAIYTYDKCDWKAKAEQFLWPKPFSSKYTEYGKLQEPHALEAYRRQTLHLVKQYGFIICDKYPWFGVSPDGVIFESGIPTKLLEIKCPYSGRDHDVQYLLDNSDYITYSVASDGKKYYGLRKKHVYYGQVQLAMAILNIKTTEFIMYSSFTNKYAVITVKFDEEFATLLLKTTTNKYFRHILHVFCEKQNVI